MTTALDLVLNGLMRRYKERVPDVEKIFKSLKRRGVINDEADIENDHIAFRTYGVPNLGLASLEKIFLHLGYIRKDPYFFESKKLNAFWYAPPADCYPRIFISELRVPDLSAAAQEIIHRYTGEIDTDPVDELDLDDGESIDEFLHRPLWSLPSWAEYQTLLSESEYAAWVLYNRYYLNHFTISVHNLPEGYDTVDNFNRFLEEEGVRLNDSGGKVKKSPDGLLIQSSTVAQVLQSEFKTADGVELRPIAGSYVEFAERKALPEFAALSRGELRRMHRRDGFEAQNADKIFESTYTTQTERM